MGDVIPIPPGGIENPVRELKRELWGDLIDPVTGEVRSCYLEPASQAEVMYDQMDFLLTHGGERCTPGCQDCQRLEELRGVLLRPFHKRKAAASGG